MKAILATGATVLCMAACALPHVNSISSDSVEIWADSVLTNDHTVMGAAVRACALYDRHPKWVG